MESDLSPRGSALICLWRFVQVPDKLKGKMGGERQRASERERESEDGGLKVLAPLHINQQIRRRCGFCRYAPADTSACDFCVIYLDKKKEEAVWDFARKPPPPPAHHDCANLLMCDVQLKVVVAGREGLGGWGGFKGGGGPSNTTIELKCTLVRSALSLPLCTITCLVLK